VRTADCPGNPWLAGRVARAYRESMVGRPAESGGSETNPGAPSEHRVTAAQLRVLALLARGSTYASIARELYLSPTTVRSHVEALQRRFGTPNNVTLVLAAVVSGVLSADVWPVELTGIDLIDRSKLQ